MSGRGDNNQHGSAGRGASNQSNQPFNESDQQGKSNHSREQTGGKPSEAQPKKVEQDANRNTSTKE
jgi:hypothetical protein